MLTKPVNGRCNFSLFDFEVQMSCVRDIPADWLKTCKYGLEDGLPVSFTLLDNGYEYAILLFDGNRASILDIIDGEKKLSQYNMGLAEFTEKLLEDIESDLDKWVNWYPAKLLGEPDAGREERLRILLADTKKAFAEYTEKSIKKEASYW